MKLVSPIALCLGIAAGFVACSLLGRFGSRQNLYNDFVRLHPYLEQETSYYPTASQLVAAARAQCPPGADKTLVILGGNSVFNGSGQKKSEVWTRTLQSDLGAAYHVINFSAPGAGVVDTGGVVFEILARENPRVLFVTNTEPGSYSPPEHSSYSYLFWDAYYKGLLPDDAPREKRLAAEAPTADAREFKLGRWLNSAFYFNDLWTAVAYRHLSTVWSSWIRKHPFSARSRLPDWYDKRPVPNPTDAEFETLLPGHLEALRRRKSVAAERFQKKSDGTWTLTDEAIGLDSEQIATLLPNGLQSRALVVLTPFNPWFTRRLDAEEKRRLEASFPQAARALEEAGFHALSTIDADFEPADFADTVHLTPAGGNRLAHLVAGAIRKLPPESSR